MPCLETCLKTLYRVFEAEMDEHLGYQKNSVEGNNTGNSRNGYSKKKIRPSSGKAYLPFPEIAKVILNQRLSKNMRLLATT